MFFMRKSMERGVEGDFQLDGELTDFSNWKNNLDITLLDLDQNDS